MGPEGLCKSQEGDRTIRHVRGLKWAHAVARPGCIPTPRVRHAAKKNGLRYEQKFAVQFPGALHGQWFEFEDGGGHGYCQPDVILSLLPSCLAVFEVKYTLVPEAFDQLYSLYLPVVEAALKSPAVGIVVVKNLVPTEGPSWPMRLALAHDLEEAVALARRGPVCLHWIGQPLGEVGHTHRLVTKHPRPDIYLLDERI